MDKLLIIDGSNLLFQMFYGMPDRIVNSQGKAIQGTLGFVGALLKIIRKVEPTHILVVFDGEHENSRCEIDADYKANRIDYSMVDEEENPFSQLPDVYKALDYLGIKYIETTDCEADDMITSYALSFCDDTNIVISSFDSDFFQLISERVSILRYRGDKTMIYSSQYIIDKYGIYPSQYAYFKSLVGDTADNIKGAEKIGIKTAASLLKEYGTLENIISNAENIDKPSIKKSILENTDRIRKNYELIKLENNQLLAYDKCDLEFMNPSITTTEVLKGIGIK
ncbi:MAG: flap endonuclease [Lachnospiraceae bacterium]|nr:flap endonuclease [Lachnospiraceae bacterium]